MAIYDTSKSEDKNRAEAYFEQLIKSGSVIELKKKQKRTLNQNSYLHLILSWFASETGYTLEYVKTEFFKRLCNPDIFNVNVHGIFGRVKDLRSTTELDTKEMTTAIDRFRNWSGSEAGIYLPAPNEDEYLQQIEIEISRKQEWI